MMSILGEHLRLRIYLCNVFGSLYSCHLANWFSWCATFSAPLWFCILILEIWFATHWTAVMLCQPWKQTLDVIFVVATIIFGRSYLIAILEGFQAYVAWNWGIAAILFDLYLYYDHVAVFYVVWSFRWWCFWSIGRSICFDIDHFLNLLLSFLWIYPCSATRWFVVIGLELFSLIIFWGVASIDYCQYPSKAKEKNDYWRAMADNVFTCCVKMNRRCAVVGWWAGDGCVGGGDSGGTIDRRQTSACFCRRRRVIWLIISERNALYWVCHLFLSFLISCWFSLKQAGKGEGLSDWWRYRGRNFYKEIVST